jgi:cytochrome c2
MFVLDNSNSNTSKRVSVMVNALWLTFCLLSTSLFAADKIGLGVSATEQQINAWDTDIRPDGKGLPVGSGNAVDGEEAYIQKCSSCHGEFAEGAGRYPALAGGIDSLDTEDPVKTVGSYWPYASTVFDYIRRAMPYGHARTLSNDEVYGMTAYILYSSEIIEDDFVLDQNTLSQVQMPNRDGFISDARPDAQPKKVCMANCLSKAPVVIGRARQIDVTPEDEGESKAVVVASSEKGEAVFAAQCMACHAVAQGENKFGPSLHNIVGQKTASVKGFSNYSAALKSSDTVWTENNLRQFLSGPQQFMPGTTMPYGGLQDTNELDSLLVYLVDKTVSK